MNLIDEIDARPLSEMSQNDANGTSLNDRWYERWATLNYYQPLRLSDGSKVDQMSRQGDFYLDEANSPYNSYNLPIFEDQVIR